MTAPPPRPPVDVKLPAEVAVDVKLPAPAEPAAVVIVSRLGVVGAAVPRPGIQGMAPGRGPGA